MIYTLTLCPAIDLHIDVNNKTNYFLAGGKGINVSKVLNNLQVKSICLGFIGGKTGQFIKKDLTKNKIAFDFVETKSPTRINMKINCEQEIEINAKPLPISKDEYNLLKAKLLKLTSKDILIISGSIPKDLDIKAAKLVLDELFKRHVNFVFDVSTKLLLDLCKYKPLFVKPNIHELSSIFNTEFKTNAKIAHYAKKLINLGAKMVLVSKGKHGAILVTKNTVLKQKAPKGKLVSSIGSGDSMVAGFLFKYLMSLNLEQSLKFAIAAGSATAFSNDLATLNNIMILFNKI